MSEFKYKNQFGVVVICADEADQELVYNTLHKLGYKLKVVCV